jgi:hypothetical protein
MSWSSTNWKLLDGSNFSLPYPSVLTQIVDTIDNSNIKFCFYKYGVENYGLPKSIPYNINIPGACKGLSNLTSVTIPDSVKYIDHYAFWDTGLTSVTLSYKTKYQSTSFPQNCTINIIDDRPFSCDSEYYIDTEVEYVINGNYYYKYNDEPSVGMIVIINAGGIYYTTGLFISPYSESAVTYKTQYGYVCTSVGSIIYDGVTWWYSSADYAIGGQYQGSGMENYSDIVNFPYTQQILTNILQSIHASMNNN